MRTLNREIYTHLGNADFEAAVDGWFDLKRTFGKCLVCCSWEQPERRRCGRCLAARLRYASLVANEDADGTNQIYAARLEEWLEACA